jgi:hypothetical protein
MVLKKVNITVDHEVWEQSKTMFPNQISSKVNDYLRTLVSYSNGDINSAQIQIERLKMDQEAKALTLLQASVKKREMKIQQFETKLAEKKTEELEAKRDELEAQTKCTTCDSPGKLYTVKDNLHICKSCFMEL